MITETVNSADGTPIVYHRTGAGPSVLFVHGTIAPTELYQSMAEQLSTDHQVVLMERRGYRISGDGPRPGTFARQASDIAAVLGAIDEPSHLFGHSFGGLATLHALASVADQVRAVALYEPPAALAGSPLVPALATCRAFVDQGRDADAIIAFWSSVGDPDPAMEQLAPMLAHRAHGLVEDLECMTSMSTAADRWSTGGLPILLMAGSEADAYAKESVALLARELSPQDTVVLPGQGHHPDDPVLVADALREFFAKN